MGALHGRAAVDRDASHHPVGEALRPLAREHEHDGNDL